MTNTTATATHKATVTSYSTIAKAVNAQVSKSVVEGKQAKIRFSAVSVFHEENCRDVFDSVGAKHVAAGLESLKNGKPLKNLTLTAIEFNDGTKGLKVIDGFHTHQITVQFIAYLKEQGIKQQKVGNTVYTDSIDTTYLAVDLLELDEYQQDLYKLQTQNNRKNDPIELIMFINRMMKQHNKTIPEIAKEIGKPESSIKNLMVLLNADEALIELVKSGAIKASRAATLMRLYMQQQGIDGRRKSVDLSLMDFSAVTTLAQREVNLYEAGTTVSTIAADTQPAPTAPTEPRTFAPNSIVTNDMPVTPSQSEAPRSRTRNALKPRQLKPSEITNIEQILILLADRENEISGDSVTMQLHVALLEQIQNAAAKIKEKNEYNKELLAVE